MQKNSTKELFRFVGLSFLVFSVSTIATIVNKAYADDHLADHDDLFIVKPIDRISEMQKSLFNIVHQTVIPPNKYHQEHDIILATIHGAEAMQILEQLELGNGIKFDVSYDNENPVIQLVKVTNIEIVKAENNIPDDKRVESLKKHL